MILHKPRLLQILTLDEAATTAARVLELRSHFTQIQSDYEVYVLGTASYLNIPYSEYQSSAARSASFLRDHFPLLYERLFAALAAALSEVKAGPLSFENGHGLPGFQILLVKDPLRDPRGPFRGPHWDWNFVHLEWQPELPMDVERLEVASFTLPLHLPATGGGLNLWEGLTSAEVSDYALTHSLKQWHAVPALIKDRTPTYHAYTPGQLVLHSGNIVHQVAPWPWQLGDVRITLQGHGLFYNGSWHIYW